MTPELADELKPSAEYIQQAKTLIGQEMYEESLVYLKKAREADPYEVEIYLLEGIACSNLENFEAAGKSFEKAKMIDKENPLPYFHLGNLAFIDEDHTAGVEYYNKAIALGYKGPDIYYNLGLIYEERGDFDMAIRNYTKASHIDPLQPGYRVRKANLYMELGHYQEAIQVLEELMQVSPDIFEGYHMSAGAYTMLKEYDKAEAILSKAELLFPEDTDILFDKIRILVVRGKLAEAISYIEKLETMIDNDVDRRNLIFEKAKIYAQKEDIDKAIELLESTRQFENEEFTDYESRYFLLNLYLIKSEYQKILENAAVMEQLDPPDTFSLAGKYYAALAMSKLGDAGAEAKYKEAITYYRKLTLQDAGLIDAYLFRCMCLKDIKEYDKALELIDYVMLLKKDSPDLHVIKSTILREKGDGKGADKELAIAKNLNPNLYIPAQGE